MPTAIRKRSKKREAIFDCLRSTTAHPSAEWIYAQLKPEIPDLSLGTVYRNLRAFREDGNAISIGVVDGLERFDARTDPHAHFVCSHCAAVIDVEGIIPPTRLCAEVTCGRAEVCELLFHGVCQNCLVNT